MSTLLIHRINHPDLYQYDADDTEFDAWVAAKAAGPGFFMVAPNSSDGNGMVRIHGSTDVLVLWATDEYGGAVIAINAVDGSGSLAPIVMTANERYQLDQLRNGG